MPIISGGGSGGLPGVTVSGAAAASKALIATSSAAAGWAYPPGFEIGYDQITASVTVSSTTESAGTSIIAAAAHTFDGGAVLAQFFAPFVSTANAAGATVTVLLFESTTEIGRLGQVQTTSANMNTPFSGFLRFTPSAAAHTYTVTAIQSGGNGTIGAQGGGTSLFVPAFIRFTKV